VCIENEPAIATHCDDPDQRRSRHHKSWYAIYVAAPGSVIEEIQVHMQDGRGIRIEVLRPEYARGRADADNSIASTLSDDIPSNVGVYTVDWRVLGEIDPDFCIEYRSATSLRQWRHCISLQDGFACVKVPRVLSYAYDILLPGSE